MALPGAGMSVGLGFDPGPGYALKTVRTGNKGIGVSIETEGIRELKAVFKQLGQPDAPFLRKGLETIASKLLAPAVRAAASGVSASFASSVVNEGVKGKGAMLRAVVAVRHQGSRSMEFGRQWYYRAYSRRNQKSGVKFNVGAGRGQQARPYLGIIKGNGVAEKVADQALSIMEQAVEQEFEALCVKYGVSDRSGLSAAVAAAR